jgi:hypothetical protein
MNAVHNLNRFINHSNIYTSFTIYGTLSGASYDKLNTDIAQHGYPAMKGPLGGVGFGISHEYYSRWVLEFYFTTLGFTNKVKKDDSTLKANFSNLLQVNFGYDFIKSNKINIYPYAGLAVRVSELDYIAPVLTNDNYTSILDIVRMDGSAYATRWSLAYQAGVNFDFVIHENADKGRGTMLFLRAGTDGTFSNSSFKIHGLKYDPQIKQGAWQIAFGFKFFGRD